MAVSAATGAAYHQWWKLDPAARASLLCIGWAGAGATPFSLWTEHLPSDINLCALRLPGRESRFEQPPMDDLDPLVMLLAEEVAQLAPGDFALFGHCSGALIAFELARELARRGAAPSHLLVASHAAPSVAFVPPEERRRPLWERVLEEGQIDERVVAVPEMRALLGPAIAADVRIADGYVYQPREQLDVCITAFGGKNDPHARVDELDAWRRETRGPFSLRLFDADHFFRGDAWTLLARAVGSALADS
jgi:surfactin synthase thioesterase subunit